MMDRSIFCKEIKTISKQLLIIVGFVATRDVLKAPAKAERNSI